MSAVTVVINTYLYERGDFMSYVTPYPVIRKKHIIRKLTQNNAFSKETAKTLEEAGVYNPNGFEKITELLCKRHIIFQTGNKYYLGDGITENNC